MRLDELAQRLIEAEAETACLKGCLEEGISHALRRSIAAMRREARKTAERKAAVNAKVRQLKVECAA